MQGGACRGPESSGEGEQPCHHGVVPRGPALSRALAAPVPSWQHPPFAGGSAPERRCILTLLSVPGFGALSGWHWGDIRIV